MGVEIRTAAARPVAPAAPVASASQAHPWERWAARLQDTLALGGQAACDAFEELKGRVGALARPAPAATPLPTLAALAVRFPHAGLPATLVGTTIDDAAMAVPGETPDSLMARVVAAGGNSVRLGAYWDQIQRAGPEAFDFAQLDALMDAAQRHGLRVVLAVGAKSPNWPEYHVPAWATPSAMRARGWRDRTADHDVAFARAAESFVGAVARHCAGHPALAMWQAENEPFDPSGPDRLTLTPDLVAREIARLRLADGGRHPVMINVWSGGDRKDAVTTAFGLADVVGLDVYGKSPGSLGAYGRMEGLPRFAAEAARRAGKPLMIAELQADNWGDYRPSADDVAGLTARMQALGIRDVLFWRLRQNVLDERHGDDRLTRVERELAAKLRGG